MNPISPLQDNLIRRVNVGDMLLRSAERFPRKEALWDAGRRFSYEELNRWTNQLAHGLLAQGFAAGDRLALMSGNRAEFLVTYFACAKLGVACVPINLLWGPNEIIYVLEHAGARGLVVEAGLLARAAPCLRSAGPVTRVIVIDGQDGQPEAGRPAGPSHVQRLDFVALCNGRPGSEPECLVESDAAISILYTSGTTSAPKGVVGSHLAICMNSLGTALDTRMTNADRVSALLPLFHTAQLNALCTPAIAAGACIVLLREFEGAALLELIERERISVLFALPMMVRSLCELQEQLARDVSSLRLCIYAMAAMPRQELLRAMELLRCEFSLMFGQTEMSPVATFFRPEHQLSHQGAVGTPATNVRVGIMGPEGQLLPAGEAGEIVYRSPQALTGYLDNEQATTEAFQGGWFHSGDAGHFDLDGILWFDDRFKDVIKTGGENVSSAEIEKAILEAEPQIAEVAVIGLPHSHWTEAITALVVARAGKVIDPDDLLARLRTRLSPFKCPKAIIMVAELPKTATGKVQKSKLRQTHVSHFA
ncbi:MAG: AMP-binding protein [Cupriavidus necator]